MTVTYPDAPSLSWPRFATMSCGEGFSTVQYDSDADEELPQE
jgi:hypothetical protein